MARMTLRDEPIGTLLSQAVERARDLAKAEIAYYRAVATGKAQGFVRPAILIVAALLILQASLTVLVAALGVAIAAWLGPAGGLAVAAIVGIVLAGVLTLVAKGALS